MLPHHFKLDAEINRDLMAGHAEFRPRELRELDPLGVDPVAALLRAGGDLVESLLLDDRGDTIAAVRPENRLIDIAGHDAALGVGPGVVVLDPVADDAADALVGNPAALPQGRLAGLVQVDPAALMAAHAEITDGPLGERVDGLLELVEHGRNRCIGVVRRTPLFVNSLMAGGAESGRRISVLGEDIAMGGLALGLRLSRLPGKHRQG